MRLGLDRLEQADDRAGGVGEDGETPDRRNVKGLLDDRCRQALGLLRSRTDVVNRRDRLAQLGGALRLRPASHASGPVLASEPKMV